jgi:hypothetical protein
VLLLLLGVGLGALVLLLGPLVVVGAAVEVLDVPGAVVLVAALLLALLLSLTVADAEVDVAAEVSFWSSTDDDGQVCGVKGSRLLVADH